MTNKEKQQILKLRNEGKSYANILRQLGINESSIKTICSRSKKEIMNGGGGAYYVIKNLFKPKDIDKRNFAIVRVRIYI